MQSYPVVIQLILTLIVVYTVPVTILVIISRWKRLTKTLQTISLLVGFILVEKINSIIPVIDKVKSIATYIFFASSLVFLFLVFKYKWFWDDEEHE